jgi:hypothetical protein
VQVGDLVRHSQAKHDYETTPCIGVVTCVDPEEIGDTEEVMVVWNDGITMYHSTYYLEVISKSTEKI